MEFKKFREGKQDSVAEIIGIRILNRQGKNVEEFDIFDPVRIEIVYDVYDENIEIPVLGVALKELMKHIFVE